MKPGARRIADASGEILRELCAKMPLWILGHLAYSRVLPVHRVAQNLSGKLAGQFTVLKENSAVDNGIMHAHRTLDETFRLAWIVVRPFGLAGVDLVGIEYDEIRRIARVD